MHTAYDCHYQTSLLRGAHVAFSTTGVSSMYVPIRRRVRSSQKRTSDTLALTLAAIGLRTVVRQLKKKRRSRGLVICRHCLVS